MADLKKILIVILVLGLTALAAWPFIGGSEPFEERPPAPRPVALLAQTDTPSLTPLTAPGEAAVAPVSRDSAVSPATLGSGNPPAGAAFPALSLPAATPPPELPQNYQPLLNTQPAKPASLEPVNPIEKPAPPAPAETVKVEKKPAEDTPQPAPLSKLKRLPPVVEPAAPVDPRTFPVYASTTPITTTGLSPLPPVAPDKPAEPPAGEPADSAPSISEETGAALTGDAETTAGTGLIPVAPATPIARTPSPEPPAAVATNPPASAESPESFSPTEPRHLLPAASMAHTPATNPLRELGEIQPLRQTFKPAVTSTAPAAATQVIRHRIVDGDTLEALATRYLGSAARANEIYAMNRGVLSHPQLLPINAVLLIRAEK